MKRIIPLIMITVALTVYQHKANCQTMETMQMPNTTIKHQMLTSQEREFAIKFLKETEADVLNAIKGLNDGQLNYKTAPDKWSVAECVKHIAAAESELWAMAQPTLQQAPNPEKRTGIHFSDDQLVKAVEDRSQKSKTFAALEPANSPYKSVREALAAFEENRKKLIAFVKSTNAALRNHVLELPVGTYDAYQFILLISAHTNRHTQQLNEVKANAGFPK